MATRELVRNWGAERTHLVDVTGKGMNTVFGKSYETVTIGKALCGTRLSGGNVIMQEGSSRRSLCRTCRMLENEEERKAAMTPQHDYVTFDTTDFVTKATEHIVKATDDRIIEILRHFYEAGRAVGVSRANDTTFELVLEEFKRSGGQT